MMYKLEGLDFGADEKKQIWRQFEHFIYIYNYAYDDRHKYNYIQNVYKIDTPEWSSYLYKDK